MIELAKEREILIFDLKSFIYSSMENKDKKITTTREEIKEVMQEVMMDGLASFNVDFLQPGLEGVKKELREEMKTMGQELREEMKTTGQELRDYTDKRVGEAEGRIIPKINTLTNILRDKNIVSEEEVVSVRKAGLTV